MMVGKVVCVVCILSVPVMTFASSCGADDLSKIKSFPADTSSKSFGALSAACGKKAYGVLSRKLDHGAFNKCMQQATGISSACSECYAVAADYGAAKCKLACMTGWCKSACLSCTESAQDDAATCSGYHAPPLKPCSSQAVEFV
eukprot:TRINITY_DN99929_c0_g1_i1.p1 TRINITY_DN99929_c0_g1~~TRINITY_DN99929_c0_g1_i1.p1  ORF type:complete len:144 (-),score=25.77 TRINITY_DN99929_c0_g1_i1:73-504(-)